jgi:FkbM family methyltransferase
MDLSPIPDLQKFHTSLLRTVVSSLKMNTFVDNFDSERYSNTAGTGPQIFDAASSEQNLTWYFKNISKIYSAYCKLTDPESRKLYFDVLCYRIVGHLSFKIPVSFSNSKDDANWMNYRKHEKYSTSVFSETFPGLKHFDFEFDGKRYICDTFGFEYYLHRKQYFYSNRETVIAPIAGDFVLDCGACTGESSVVFANAVGPEGHVFAFDPLANHIQVIEYNIQQNRNLNIDVVPYAVSNETVHASPVETDAVNPGFNSFQPDVPKTSIDDFVHTSGLKKVDFIKMDIEGAELNALQGALQTLRQHKPKLAISIYHYFDDYQSIINFLSELDLYENMALGHYSIHREETVLYCS